MANATQIKSLLQSHGDGDHQRFYAVALQVAATEARRGHQKLADELRTLVRAAQQRAETTAASGANVFGIATPSGEARELLDVVPSTLKLSDLVLNEDLRNRVARILSEQKNLGRLKERGLRPRQRLLFTGPPGCGKTATAGALAAELGLPLFVVRLDGLISRFLGDSLSKLRLVFEAVESTRAVYLFDEFDSIGYTRDAANEVGEMRRVLNAFLVFIEKLTSNSLVIAATNHGSRLDRALFRRFDDLIEFGLPGRDQSRDLIKSLLGDIACGKLDWRRLDPATQELSYSELTRACEEAIKDMLINEREEVTTASLVTALTERRVYLNH